MIFPMKKVVAILLLFGVVGIAANFSAVRADVPVPIAERLGLRPMDPTPVAVAFASPDPAI